MALSTDAPFAPPSSAWQRLSPRYIAVVRLGSLVSSVLFFGVLAVGSWLIFHLVWLTAAFAGVGLIWLGWRLIRARRWVESWGYAERESDLCVRKGLLWRELIVVPIGRLQMVKVSSGPLLKAFGLATVELVTASPQSDAKIPGLPSDAAVALRDRLIDLSDAPGSGL